MTDEEDTNNETREDMAFMSVGDHLEELRKRLIYSFLGFLIFFIIALFFQDELLWIITRPHMSAQKILSEKLRKLTVEDPVEIAWKKQLAAANITLDNGTGLPLILNEAGKEGNASNLSPEEMARLRIALQYADHVRTVNPPPQLMVLKYQESFLIYMKVCAVFALLLGIPFTLYNFWKFIAAGLYPHERSVVYIAAPLSLGLFVAGILFGYFFLIRFGLKFLITYGNPEIIRSSMTLGFYFGLFVLLTLVVGIIFQLPMVMLALARIGIVSPRSLRKHRKIAILLAVIVGAILTPPDPVTQIMLAMPVIFLYEFGLILVRLTVPDEEEEDSDTAAAEAKA
ncbi:MAG: twin-arginine translocase subunit TatC [Planctomycetota bacterium]|nr:MAG: twin-arginine translocase subunit TatC [Planctomycetota bacterium]